MKLVVVILKVLVCLVPVSSVIGMIENARDILNTCIDAKHHKSLPGPEDSLFQQCSPWKKRSCCTSATTESVHEGNLYSLNYDHCKGRKPLSDACRRHFVQDHCFYECSPNVGPWVVQEPHRTWRNERFYKAPLCSVDCDSWFNDCSDDFTCIDNWFNFEWITVQNNASNGSPCKNGAKKCKVNVCPNDSPCVTFAQMFGDAKNFCEKVWDDTWEYTDSSSPCLRLWFDGEAGNPNDRVAELNVGRRFVFNRAGQHSIGALSLVTVLLLLL